MRTTATSGLTFSFCLSVAVLTVLMSLSSRVYAKRGCSAFGHSCFGGHGKRFDPFVRVNVGAQEDRNIDLDDKIQDENISESSNDPFFVDSNRKFEGQQEQAFAGTQQDPQRFDPYTLSLFVDQWLASHRRPHRSELKVDK